MRMKIQLLRNCSKKGDIMSCISCEHACENYMYSAEHGCDIMYRTCEKRHDAPIDDDETCEHDTSKRTNFIKPEAPFMLLFEDKEDNLSVAWLKTENDLLKTKEEVISGGCHIIKAMEIGSYRIIE